MTSFIPFEPGTIEVTAGSKNIVGTDTDFTVYGDGDTIWVDGYPVLLDGDPVDETHALARFNYLGGSGAGKAYRWVPLPDLSRALALDTRISSYFTSGNLPALAGLTGVADKVPYFTGAGTMDLADFTADARDLFTRWKRATGASSAYLDFHEDTDDGANRVRVTAPVLSADRQFMLPNANVTMLAYIASLLNAGNHGAAQTAIGITAAAQGLLDDANVGAMLTTLGFSPFVSGLVDNANGGDFLSDLGIPYSAGSYTPTATAGTNVTSVTPSIFRYLRLGALCISFGRVAVDPVAASASAFKLSVPVAVSMSTFQQLWGIGTADGTTETWGAFGSSVDNDVNFGGVAVNTANHNVYIAFAYQL